MATKGQTVMLKPLLPWRSVSQEVQAFGSHEQIGLKQLHKEGAGSIDQEGQNVNQPSP